MAVFTFSWVVIVRSIMLVQRLVALVCISAIFSTMASPAGLVCSISRCIFIQISMHAAVHRGKVHVLGASAYVVAGCAVRTSRGTYGKIVKEYGTV